MDKDVDKNGNTIHCTFEFVNLLSDENGYSLVTQWNDTNDENTANHKYTKSTIRHALNGEDVDDVLWAQKGQTTWSSNYTCSVLDMLDEGNLGLVDVIKAPSKWININNGDGWEEETINDKLFLLSPVEMGGERSEYEETKTVTYSYYDGATDDKRIKKQVKGDDPYAPDNVPVIPDDKEQIFEGSVNNHAGYNMKADETGGGYSWLRSSRTKNSNSAFLVGFTGWLGGWEVYNNTSGVAPAFCI